MKHILKYIAEKDLHIYFIHIKTPSYNIKPLNHIFIKPYLW